MLDVQAARRIGYDQCRQGMSEEEIGDREFHGHSARTVKPFIPQDI